MLVNKYFADTVILPVFAIAIIWILRKWNKDRRTAALLVAVASVLVLYNGVTYAVAERFGETNTYYRFFWICPVVIITSMFVVELLFKMDKKQKLLFSGIMIVGVCYFSSKAMVEWIEIPENIYQIDSDVIQVADIIMDLEDGEFTTIVDNGTIKETIRQYTARIGFTDLEQEIVEYMLSGKNTNYIGRYFIEQLAYNNSDYVILKKDKPVVCRLVESVGLSQVAESDNYYIYKIDTESIQADVTLLREYEIGRSFESDLEYIQIEEIEDVFDIVYLSDFGSQENDTIYKEVLQAIEELQPKRVIINSQLAQNRDWYVKMQEEFEQLEISCYYNDKDFQIIEEDEFLFCLIDNTKEVTEETIKQFKELHSKGIPIILVLSVELNYNDKLYKIVTDKNSMVEGILAARKNEYYKCFLEERLLQYATPTDSYTRFNIIRVKGK